MAWQKNRWQAIIWCWPNLCTPLTHWGQVTHICVGNLTIIGSDNGLSPGRRQAIIWTSAEILLIGPLGSNFSEILIEILTFSFKKMCLKVLSAKWRPFCLGLNVLTQGLKLTLISRSNFLLLLSKSWSKSDRHRSYFLSLKADIWLDWVAKLCS